MKKIIFSIIFFFVIVFCNAQLVLESSNYPVLLHLIHLEHSGFKYSYVDQNTKVMYLYNLDHSLYKTINMPSFPNSSPIQWYFPQYVTETLWDTDSTDIDYAICAQDTDGTNFLRILHEDGTTLFSRDSASFYFGLGQEFGNPLCVPIFNTDSGTKMILWCGAGHNPRVMSSSSVYCLPGHLECDVCYNFNCDGRLNGITSENISNRSLLSNPYPNPTNTSIALPFNLPENESKGEIVLHNMQGIIINRYKVDRTFDTIIINNADLPPGTYFYELLTSHQVSGSKKMIVVK